MNTYFITLGDAISVLCNNERLNHAEPLASLTLDRISGVSESTLTASSQLLGTSGYTIRATPQALKSKYTDHVAAFVADLLKTRGQPNTDVSFIFRGPNVSLLDDAQLNQYNLKFRIQPQSGNSAGLEVLKKMCLAELLEWKTNQANTGQKDIAYERIKEALIHKFMGLTGRDACFYKLDLSGLRLNTLPACFSDLTHLREIDLSNNCLTTMPRTQHFYDLTLLNLESNELSKIQPLPASLRTLNLSLNMLLSFPENLNSLENLETLDLSGNFLSEFPDITSLRSLKSFKFSNNYWHSLPDIFDALPNLEELDVSKNNFKELPASLVRRTSLKSLNIAKTEVESLPEGMGALSDLEVLDVSGNKLTTLPDEIFCLPKLTTLNASHNSIASLSHITGQSKLKHLDLSNNHLGALPPSIGRMSSIASLDVSSNRLVSIPDTLIDCEYLLSLKVIGNRDLQYLPAAFIIDPRRAEVSLIDTAFPQSIGRVIKTIRRYASALGSACPLINIPLGAPTFDHLSYCLQTITNQIDPISRIITATLISQSEEMARIQARLIAINLRRNKFVESADPKNCLSTQMLPPGFFENKLESILLIIFQQRAQIQKLMANNTRVFKISKKDWPGNLSIYFARNNSSYSIIVNFGKSQTIGLGGYKLVTRALSLLSCEPIALAKTEYIRGSREVVARNELAMTYRLPSHPTLMRPLFDTELRGRQGVTKQVLMMPLHLGSLHALMSQLDNADKMQVGIDMLTSISILQSLNITHRDIKTGNFLVARIDGKYRAILSDFGMATVAEIPERIAGTYDSLSPTSLRCLAEGGKIHPADLKKEDNWAVGLILYQMFIDRTAHRKLYKEYKKLGYDRVGQAYRVRHASDLNTYQEPIHLIIHGLMKPNTAYRMSITEALTKLTELAQASANKRTIEDAEEAPRQKRIASDH